MFDLSEAELGAARISALVHRDRVAHDLICERHGKQEETEAYLAFLGWTAEAFLVEAYPELQPGYRG